MSPPVPLCVLSADWQCQIRAWQGRPDLKSDAFFALEQVVDYCIAQSLPLVGAGDLLDARRPDPTTVSRLHRLLDRMSAAALDVWYIQGNHDYDETTPWLSTHPWPRHLHRDAMEWQADDAGGVSICMVGVDYTTPDRLISEINTRVARTFGFDVVILVAHQMWAELNNGRGDARIADLQGVDVLFSGDLHKTVLGVHPGVDSDVLVLSPGSLAMQSIDEPDDKYFFVLYDDLTVEKVRLKTRTVVRRTVNDAHALAELLAGLDTLLVVPADLPEDLRKPILEVTLTSDVPAAMELLKKHAGPRAHLFVHFPGRVGEDETAAVATAAAVTGYAEALGGILPADSRPYAVGRRLLEADDPARQLDEIRTEVLSK